MDPSDFSTVLRRARHGDRHALDDLLSRNRDRLQRAARALLGRNLRAKVRTSDILQSTYLDVLSYVPTFRGSTEEAFSSWVVRILENNVRDAAKYFRAGKRAKPHPSSSKDVVEVDVPDARPSPSAEAVVSEELLLVSRALQRLPDDYRRIILLRLKPGSSHRDAARRMNRSEGATRVLLARARAALLLEVDRLRSASHAR